MLYCESQSTDPYFNISLEWHLFCNVISKNMHLHSRGFEQYPYHEVAGQSVFMLWQNDNAIIIGINQNAEAEINRQFVDAHGIKVARRKSGGGAVYHDLGNLNFTFIVPDGDDINFQYFCRPVLQTLAQFGVEAEVHGRNDITIDGKKFSGNAQCRRDGWVLHHGTIMFSCDLDTLQQSLSPPEVKIQSKGVKSIRSRVTNIREHLTDDVTLDMFKDALKKNVLPKDHDIYMPSDTDIKHITHMRDTLLSTWQWNFGRSPQYSIQKKRRVEGCGTLEFYLDIKDGKIAGIECFGDFFGNMPYGLLTLPLVGCELRPEAIAEAIDDLDINDFFYNLPKETFIEILCE